MRLFVLALCLAASVTVAYSSNLILEAALLPDLPAAPAPRPLAAEPQPRALDATRLARTFGTPLRPKPGPAPVRPMLPLKLLGTLDDHAAALTHLATGMTRTLRIGDRWDDIELKGVGHGRVTVLRGEVEEELGIGVTPAKIWTPQNYSSALPITLTGRGGSIAMPRSELERRLPELMKEAMDSGRVVPAFREGAMVGFKVFAVRPGTLYDQLGLKNGDVIETVNGESLANPQVAFTMLGRLRESPNVSVGVTRGADRLTWQLTLN